MALMFALLLMFGVVSMQAQEDAFCDQLCDPFTMRFQVCGSDGQTYKDECALKKAVCISKKPVSIVHPGKCEFKGKDCLHKIPCGMEKDQICASDGKPYYNECAMRKHACQDKEAKIGVSVGLKCSSCPKCEGEKKSPVCGSDHKTYDSICELRAAACKIKKAIILLKNGACSNDKKSTDKKEKQGGLGEIFSDLPNDTDEKEDIFHDVTDEDEETEEGRMNDERLF